MDQLAIAIRNTAKSLAGGLTALASRMGIGEQVLRNKCNPNSDRHKLSLREAQGMMLQTGNLEILQTLAAEHNHAVVPILQPDDTSCLVSAVLRTIAEHGSVQKEIVSAWADKKITPRERNAINRQIAAAVNELYALQATVAAHTHNGPAVVPAKGK